MSIDFNKYTIDILNKLPFWFKIKKNYKDSIGAQFLNTFGLELNELEEIINHAYNMCSLESFNNDTYICYKAIVKTDITSVTSNGDVCTEYDTEKEFVNNIKTKCYYYDSDHQILYVSTNDNVLVNTVTITLETQYIWLANILDEFGLILDLPRLKQEDNLSYKIRLLSYENFKPNSSINGIYNLLAHHLDLVKTLKWNNGKDDIIIEDSDICGECIYVDGKPFYNFIKTEGGVVLYGDEEYANITRDVTYYVGIQILNMHEYETNSLYQDLYNTDHTATDKLLQYSDRINSICPILWGMSRWDNGYWLEEYDNYMFIPNTFDKGIKYNTIPKTTAWFLNDDLYIMYGRSYIWDDLQTWDDRNVAKIN